MTERQRPPTHSFSRADVRIMVVHGTGSYALGVTRGVMRFASRRASWEVEFADALPHPGYLRVRGVRGLVVQMLDSGRADEYRALGLVAVNVADNHGDRSLPTVISDNQAIGAMAAKHLLERNLHEFAFYGQQTKWYAQERHAGFARHLREAGCKVHTLFFSDDQVDQAALGRWLRGLPRPTGLLAENDVRAMEVMRACEAEELAVPRDLAVIGVDNDVGICETRRVPLSSVMINDERIGLEAAAVIHRMLAGEAPPIKPIEIAPIGVESRESTDCFAVRDRWVAKATTIIHENLNQEWDIDDLADRMGVSRRHLDRRFRQALGRTPTEELRRQRIERAKILLRDTNQKIIDIAMRSGFTGACQFSVAFRHATGTSPRDYRQQVQTFDRNL